MTITLTREEAQQVLDALSKGIRRNDWKIVCDAHNEMKMRLAQPEPDYRDVVIKGDLWRIEFLPDHAASVVLVRANYEAQPEPPWINNTQTGNFFNVAQPEPEPVAWLNKLGNGAWIADVLKCEGDEPSEPLYATPPQREWQGLTDEDFSAINQSCSTKLQAATSAESILKEKNI